MKRVRAGSRLSGPPRVASTRRLSMHGLRRRAWLVVFSTVMCGAAAAGIAATQDATYRGIALVVVRPAHLTEYSQDAQRRVDTEKAVIESDAVEHRAQQDLAVLRDLPDVVASSTGQSDAVTIRVDAGDARLAAALANAYATAYIEVSGEQDAAALQRSAEQLRQQLDEIEGRLDQLDTVDTGSASERAALVDQRTATRSELGRLETAAAAQIGGATIASEATVVHRPIAPRPLRAGALGAALGLLLGLALALVAEVLDTSIHTVADVVAAAGIPVLAVIPPIHGDGRRPVAFARGNDAAAEAFRTLRTELQLATRHRPFRSLLVTGTTEQVGTTTIALNLAVFAALTGRRVALVDGNLRSPRLQELFTTTSKGLTAALLGVPVLDSLHPVALPTGHLEVLTVGFVPTNPSETIGSPGLSALLGDLAQMFDMVVIDAPPVLASSDAMVLSNLAEAVVVVCEAHRTTSTELRDARATLDRAGASVAGAVLTKCAASR